jgi:hypothetical protein
MSNKPQPVMIMTGVLAGVGAILGSTTIAGLLPPVVLAWALLVYSGAMVTWGFITKSQVTPNPLVAVREEPPREVEGGITKGRELVAGPALARRTALGEGEPVEVVAAGAPTWTEGRPDTP